MNLLPRADGPINAAAQAFQSYVNSHQGEHVHNGFNGWGETRRFFCLTGLTEYWTDTKISEELGLKDFPLLNDFLVRKIMRSYIRIFSTLCYVGYSAQILEFVIQSHIADVNLPFLAPAEIGIQPTRKDFASRHFWASFYQAQWRFTPVEFGEKIHQGRLPVDQILPIRNREKLPVRTGMVDVSIYKVSLYPCCNHLPEDEVVFKTFNTQLSPKKLADIYATEAATYARLCGQMSPKLKASNGSHTGDRDRALCFEYPEGVIKCFGSFSYHHLDINIYDKGQHGISLSGETDAGTGFNSWCTEREAQIEDRKGDKREMFIWTDFVILKYAAGGSLVDFVRSNASLLSSSKWSDQRSLWCQLFNILLGLESMRKWNL